jgi:glycine/D-amino acid oxidase-like deaminating enzyme
MSSSPYPTYLRRCGWTTDSDASMYCKPLQGEQYYDAIVIGAGYTGLAIARRLVEQRPDYAVAVLEADSVGAGSPGRNSGFVLETVLSAPSKAKAEKIYPLYQQAHQQLMLHSRLPTEAKRATIFKAAATLRGEKALKQLSHFLQSTGQSWRKLDAERLKQITGSDYYRSGISLPGNRLVNPARLVSNIARHLPDSVTIYEKSPALELEQHQGNWKVRTSAGALSAPQVFLANNAFAKGLGVGQSRSMTIFTYAGITAPLSTEERIKISSQGQWGVLPAHRLGTTFRSTEDGRLLVRGMYGYEQEGGSEVKDILQQSLRKRFPGLGGTQQLEQWWGGTTSLTANGAPLWGELKPGLFSSVGCNGVGIVKGWLLGGALADLSLGHKALDVPTLFGRPSWMPPEPLRQLGFMAVSSLEKQLAGGEK